MASWAAYQKRRKGWAAVLLAFMAALFTLNLIFPPLVTQANHVSSVVNDMDGRMLSSFTVEDGTWRLPADLEYIDPRFVERLIAIEDKRFFRHSGVDLPAIARALRSWRREGEIVSGASTLTMQLVRQLEPRPRNLRSKIIEVVRALQIELWMSKEDILQSYLSHVSYGGNIEGIEAATRLYFGKTPEYLTDGEIALLISLPQAPEARRPDRRPEAAVIARDHILDKLVRVNLISETAAREAKETLVKAARSSMPDTAWITAHGLSQDKSGGAVGSTLESGLQLPLEALVKTHVNELEQSVNTAVIVVENKTMAVRAHIASADRARPGGWIDMTTRLRSPGSTLKPFIYGLAMDEGLVSAGSVAFDAPTRFGAYRPENFNRRYHGNVRIYDALRHSLNVPAVAALDLIGGDHFEQSLTEAGAKMSRLGRKSDKAGLALALGGVGMSLNDVAMLYAALANGGEARPLNWQGALSQSPSFPLLNSQSATEITRILAQAPTPDGRMPSWLREGGASIAYKTGTSYGFRDAWAAGYTDDFTVVVWVGRPDGAPRIGQTGRTAAAPLLFDIFDMLPSNGGDTVYRKDDDAPIGLKALGQKGDKSPHILFPPDGAEIYTDQLGETARGFTISARVEGDRYSAYVNGLALKKTGRHYVWRPETAGFHTLTVVDEAGRQSKSAIRVLTNKSLAAQSTAFHDKINAPL